MPIPLYNFYKVPDDHDLWVNGFSERYPCKPVERLSLNEPVSPNKVRFVCISDTHEKLRELLASIPEGDVLIHCGDFTNTGSTEELERFNNEIGSLRHRYKIVVAGNHELGFEDGDNGSGWIEEYTGKGTSRGYNLLTNCIYLQDKSIKVFGLTIYGSSWHPLPGFPFYRQRGEQIAKEWEKIPTGVDVLITHGPPLGILDVWRSGRHWGCAQLLKNVRDRVQPRVHVFGHLHEQNGVVSGGKTMFINSSICGHGNRIKNSPVLFDIELPEGIKKDDFNF